MTQTYYGYQKIFSKELEITTAGVAVEFAFSQKVDAIVVYSPISVWVDESDVTTPGSGLLNGERKLVPAATYRVIPWRWDTFKCVNSELGETGIVTIEGLVE